MFFLPFFLTLLPPYLLFFFKPSCSQARKTTRLYEEVLMQCAPDLARKLLEVRQQGELQSTSLRQAAEEAL